MTAVTSFRSDSLPAINTGLFHVQKVLNVVSGSAAQNDTINVMGVAPQQKLVLHRASIRTSATLGASATAQLRAKATAITTATTAGSASKVDSDSDSDVPINLDGGDVIDILIAGAGIGATATITVDLVFSARP